MKYLLLLLFLFTNIYSFNREDNGIISVWENKNGKFVIVEEKRDTDISKYTNYKKEEELINLVQNFYPQDLLNKYVHSINIYTDGIDNDFAYVESVIGSNNKKWNISFDIQDSYNDKNGLYHKYFFETMVHEFMHILSLNHEQVDYSSEDIGTYYLQEGASKKNSYINLFYQRFWENARLSKYLIDLEYDHNYTSEEVEDIREELYAEHRSKFVNSYAMTNPTEDLAESFTYFVYANNLSKTNSIKDKKMKFFKEFPELRQLKEHFKNKTQYYLRKNRKND